MNIFSRLFSPSKTNHTYRVENGRLAVEAKTLDGAYAGQRRLKEAGDMFTHATRSKDLSTHDGGADDVDLRAGHVILPQERFESHDGVGTFSTQMAGYKDARLDCQDSVEDKGDGVEVTRTWDGGWISPKVDATARLDAGAGTFMVTADTEKLDKARYESWGKTEFLLGADGKAALSQPESLKDYEENESQKYALGKINNLIEAASLWRAHGESLDGSTGDVNPAAGETVIPHTDRGNLSGLLSEEKVLSELVYGSSDLRDARRPYESFGIEVAPDHFIVDAVGTNSRPRLTGKTEGDITTIRLEDRISAESIEIDKANGTITYQSYHQI